MKKTLVCWLKPFLEPIQWGFFIKKSTSRKRKHILDHILDIIKHTCVWECTYHCRYENTTFKKHYLYIINIIFAWFPVQKALAVCQSYIFVVTDASGGGGGVI